MDTSGVQGPKPIPSETSPPSRPSLEHRGGRTLDHDERGESTKEGGRRPPAINTQPGRPAPRRTAFFPLAPPPPPSPSSSLRTSLDHLWRSLDFQRKQLKPQARRTRHPQAPVPHPAWPAAVPPDPLHCRPRPAAVRPRSEHPRSERERMASLAKHVAGLPCPPLSGASRSHRRPAAPRRPPSALVCGTYALTKEERERERMRQQFDEASERCAPRPWRASPSPPRTSTLPWSPPTSTPRSAPL
uniref:Uncharacterized protein n=1 Tax=Setaria viridis TaxID=4556 RepID=A0A4U6W7P1_SETVI|nr:hypothetical protein SEVIR_1G103400v2 [Setaria viridis]